MGGLLFDMDQVRRVQFNEEIKWGAEDILWLEQVRQEHGEALLVPSRLYYIRMHADRISNKKKLPSNKLAREASDKAYEEELKRLRK